MGGPSGAERGESKLIFSFIFEINCLEHRRRVEAYLNHYEIHGFYGECGALIVVFSW